MADQDDNVLKKDDVQEETVAVDTAEQPLAELSEEEQAGLESIQLVRGEREKFNKALDEAADENGPVVVAERVAEHKAKTRDKVTGAMKLDFLGDAELEESEADAMPSSLGEEKELAEPANSGWVKDSEAVAVTATTMLFDPTPAARMTEAGARAAQQSDWFGPKGKKLATKVEKGARATRQYMERNQEHFEARFLGEDGQQAA